MESVQVKVVKTKAKKTRVVEEKNGILFMEVAAPPKNDQANLELIRFFSKEYGKFVRIVRGTKTRKKVLALD